MSHGSATIRRGAPDWGLDLAQVHLLKLDGRGGRRRDDLVHHAGQARVEDVTLRDGAWLTDGARTVLDIAGEHGFEAGLVQADWYLHHGFTTKQHLLRTYESRERWPGSLPGRLLIGFADGRAESVAETLARRLFNKVGIPAPELQVVVADPTGRTLGRVDFAWPALKIFGEIDGKVKVTTLLKPGETAADVLLREKRRERSIIEATGWRVLRLEWADLFHPERVERRFRALVQQAA